MLLWVSVCVWESTCKSAYSHSYTVMYEYRATRVLEYFPLVFFFSLALGPFCIFVVRFKVFVSVVMRLCKCSLMQIRLQNTQRYSIWIFTHTHTHTPCLLPHRCAHKDRKDRVLPLSPSSHWEVTLLQFLFSLWEDYKRQIFLRCWEACIIEVLPQIDS